jgi:hypothetical protein
MPQAATEQLIRLGEVRTSGRRERTDITRSLLDRAFHVRKLGSPIEITILAVDSGSL